MKCCSLLVLPSLSFISSCDLSTSPEELNFHLSHWPLGFFSVAALFSIFYEMACSCLAFVCQQPIMNLLGTISTTLKTKRFLHT